MLGTGSQQQFNWTGAAENVQAATPGGDTLGSFQRRVVCIPIRRRCTFDGLRRVTNLEWIMQSNGRTIMLPNGKPKSYSYQLEVNGVNPFQSSELTGLRCVAQVAH